MSLFLGLTRLQIQSSSESGALTTLSRIVPPVMLALRCTPARKHVACATTAGSASAMPMVMPHASMVHPLVRCSFVQGHRKTSTRSAASQRCGLIAEEILVHPPRSAWVCSMSATEESAASPPEHHSDGLNISTPALGASLPAGRLLFHRCRTATRLPHPGPSLLGCFGAQCGPSPSAPLALLYINAAGSGLTVVVGNPGYGQVGARFWVVSLVVLPRFSAPSCCRQQHGAPAWFQPQLAGPSLVTPTLHAAQLLACLQSAL